METISIVRGNDFRLRIPIKRHVLQPNGTVVKEDFAIEDASVLKVFLEGCDCHAIELPWTEDEEHESSIICDVDGLIPLGTYHLVVAGYRSDGAKFRSKERRQLRIVENNERANIWPSQYDSFEAYSLDTMIILDVRGRDGLSAYEIAVLNGFTGTETQWLKSLAIKSIVKTGTDYLTDTYTITYSNGATSTYQVQNGESAYQAAVRLGKFDGTEEEWATYARWPEVEDLVDHVLRDMDVNVTEEDVEAEASADMTYDEERDPKVQLNLHNIKGRRGNGIASVEQTVESQENDGVNVVTITDDDGHVVSVNIKNGAKGEKGDKGDQGDSAVYNPDDPEAPDFEMANTTGQSTTKAMTQKAVTDAIDGVNHPYIEPVLIQDSFSSYGTFTNNSSVETMSEVDGVYTYNRIASNSACGFYIGPIASYDYTKQHYLHFDLNLAKNQVGDNTYIVIRKGNKANSTVFAASAKYNTAGSRSGYVKLPKTNPSATLYIAIICTGVPVGSAGLVLSNIRLVKEDDTTLPEKIGELEEELNNIPIQFESSVVNYIQGHQDEEPTGNSTNLMYSGSIYEAFDKANHPLSEPVTIQSVFETMGFSNSSNEVTFTENEGVYTLTRIGTTGSGRCWIGVLDNYDLSKTTRLEFDLVLYNTHVVNYTYFEVRTTQQESSILCGRTLVHTAGTYHVEILLNKTDRGKYFGFQYTGIPKRVDGSPVLTISNLRLVQYDDSSVSQLFDILLSKTDTIDLNAPQIAKSNDVDKTKNMLTQFTRVIGTNTIKPLVLLHFSDLHGCSTNIARINEYRNYYSKYIDVAIHTGDLITSHWAHDTDFYFDNEENADILNVVGNHDVMSYYNGAYHADHVGKDCYDRFFAPFIEGWDVVQPVDAEENGYCWYYKDYDANKIRIVVIDVMNNIDAQRTWFGGVLDDALTQGLHVIVAAHYRFYGGTNIDSVFTQIGTTTTPDTYIANEYLIMVKTFKDSGGNFVCWLNGHHHADAVQMSNVATGNQLAINVNSSGDGEQVKNSPISRTGIDRNVDSFNIVAVDTVYHKLSVYKVGSEFDKWGRRFGTLCIDYQTNDIIWND